jgi:hypothetical protein
MPIFQPMLAYDSMLLLIQAETLYSLRLILSDPVASLTMYTIRYSHIFFFFFYRISLLIDKNEY